MATTNPFLQSPFQTLINQQEQPFNQMPGSDAVKDVVVPELEAAPVEPVKQAPVVAAAPRKAAKPKSLVPPEELRPLFEVTAQEFGVPANVLMAIVQQESSYNNDATNSETGAAGMAQYMGATAKSLKINPRDPNESIPATAMQLKERLDKGMSIDDAIREHFAGPDRKIWGPKTAAYGTEVLAKAEQIGNELYGAPAPVEQPKDQNNFAADRQGRADYEKNFRSLNPRADQAAVDMALGQYDQQAKARTKAKGSAVTDRFAALQSPEAMFNQRLDAKLQAKNKGVAQVAPGRQQPDDVNTLPSRERPGIVDQAAGDFGRGIENLRALGYGAGGLAADAAGDEEAATQLLDEYVNIQNDIAKNNPATIGTYKNVKSLGDAGRYAIEAVAENLPMLIPSLLSGGVGAQVAKKGAERLVGGMIEAQVAKGVAKEVAERQAAQFIAKRVMAGSIAGAVPASVGMEAGSIGGDIYKETGRVESGTALAYGIPAGLLDAVGPVMALRKIAGPIVDEVAGSVIRRLGAEAGKQFLAEAGTEGLQTIIEQAASAKEANRELWTPELLDNVIDAALKGGIGGGVMGVASQGVAEARGAMGQPQAGQPQRIEPTMAEIPAQPVIEPQTVPAIPGTPAQVDDEGFTAQIMGDDGLMHTIDSRTGVTMAEAPVEPKGPLETAIAEAAEQHANDPAPAPAMPEPEPVAPDYSVMPVEDLRMRLKEVAQLSQQGDGQRKQLAPERKAIERAINDRAKQAKADSKPAEEVLSIGPFDDMKAANKMMSRYAEATGVPHEVVGSEGSFRVQRIKESDNGINSAGTDGGIDGRGRSGGTVTPVGDGDGVRPEGAGDGAIDGQPGTTGERRDNPVPDPVRADGPADAQPALKDYERNPHQAYAFSKPEGAQGLMEKRAIDATKFEVKQTGPVRWQVVPRTQPVEAEVMPDVSERTQVPEEAPVESGAQSAPKTEVKPAETTGPINLVRMTNAADFDWSRIKPNGTYASIADDPSSFVSPFSDDYKNGRRVDLQYTPKKPLVVGELKAKHARFRGALNNEGETSAGVKALHAFLSPDQFTAAMQMSKPQVQDAIAKKFPKVDASKAHDAYEALEIWGAQEAKAAGHDVIIARDEAMPEFSEAVLLEGAVEPKPAAKKPKKAAAKKPAEAKRKAEPIVMSEESYLATNGASRQDFGDAALHRSSSNVGESAKRNAIERQSKKDSELAARREELRAEYQKKVAAGEMRPPTSKEENDRTAQGDPDSEATQAARRIQEKIAKRKAAKFSVADELTDSPSAPITAAMQKLADDGKIFLHDDAASLPFEGKMPAGVQAMTAKDGTIHVVAGSDMAVVLHEAFHSGAQKLIGTAKWNSLMTRLDALYRQSERSTGKAREFFDAARGRVATAKAKGAVADGMAVEEFGAYAIEEYESAPLTVRKWTGDMIGTVKAWALRRFGAQLGQVSPAQLSALAKSALADVQAAPVQSTAAAKPDAMFSVAGSPQPRSLTPDEQGMLRRVQAQIQDANNRVKQVQDRIKEVTGVDDLGNADYYRAETNRPGRIAARKEDARDKMFGPLMANLAKAGYKPAQLEEILHAQHAKERNANIAAINPEHDPASPEYSGTQGSGMNDDKADEILKKYANDPELKRFADQARNIAKETLELKLQYGLINKEDHDSLVKAYENYVPLKGDGQYGPKVKRAMGHGARNENIMENIARDYEQAVVVGEKNLARQSLLQMVLQFPDDGLWTARVPPKGRMIAGKVYNIVDVGPTAPANGETVASFTSRSQVDAFLEGLGANRVNHKVLDSNGEQVAEFTKPLQDNEVMVYLKGDPVRLQIFDESLAGQLRPLHGEQMNAVLDLMRRHNRYLSMIFTGYNPAFIIKNATRDAITGTINMTGNHGAVTSAKAWAKYPAAWATMLKWAATKKTPNTEMGRILDEYRAQGGKTGASYMSDLEEQGKDLARMFDDAKGAFSYAKDGQVGKAAWITARKAIGGLAHVVEVLNQAFENALRLALFAQLRAEGQKPGIAAAAAKSVTVNFDRKGVMTPQLGAFYLFINPAIQGTANMSRTMTQGENKYQAWALTGMMAAAGFAAAVHGMDDDKDRWLGESWGNRTKGLRFRVGETTINIPMSYEFAPFYAIGVAMGEVARGESSLRAAVRVMSSFLDAYYPMQGAVQPGSDNNGMDLLLAHLPTVARVPGQVWLNRNSFGSQVAPETNTTKNRPDNLKMNRGTKNSVYDKTAQAIADAGELIGADKYSNDLTKVSPETLKLIYSTYTGGLGRFIADSAGFAGLSADGDVNLELADVPILKDFARGDNMKPIRTRYFDLSDEARKSIDEFAQAKKMGDRDEMKRIVKDPERRMHLAMAKMVKSVNEVQGIFSDQAVLINANKDLTPAEKRAKLKAIEDEQEAIYRKSIKAFQP